MNNTVATVVLNVTVATVVLNVTVANVTVSNVAPLRPDRGVPRTGGASLKMLKHMRCAKWPTVVHCSAGVGESSSYRIPLPCPLSG